MRLTNIISNGRNNTKKYILYKSIYINPKTGKTSLVVRMLLGWRIKDFERIQKVFCGADTFYIWISMPLMLVYSVTVCLFAFMSCSKIKVLPLLPLKRHCKGPVKNW